MNTGNKMRIRGAAAIARAKATKYKDLAEKYEKVGGYLADMETMDEGSRLYVINHIAVMELAAEAEKQETEPLLTDRQATLLTSYATGCFNYGEFEELILSGHADEANEISYAKAFVEDMMQEYAGHEV